MKKFICAVLVVSLSFVLLGNNKKAIIPVASDLKTSDLEKELIKKLRLSVRKNNKQLSNKIVLKIEKYYCSTPGFEKGFELVTTISNLIGKGQFQNAVNLINESLSKNKKSFNPVALNVLLILKVKALLELKEVKLALKEFKVIEDNRKINPQNVPDIYRINVMYNLATCEDILKNYSSALGYYKEYIILFKKFYKNSPFNESYLYKSIGRCYRELGKFNDAHKSFQLGMKCAKDEFSKAMIWGAMGMNYFEQKKYVQAIKSYDESLKFFLKNKSLYAPKITSLLLEKSKAYIRINKNAEALKTLNATKIILGKYQNKFAPSLKAELWKGIGDEYFSIAKYSQAEEAYLNALSFEKYKYTDKMPVALFELYDMLGLTYLKLKQYQKCRDYYKLLLDHSIEEYGVDSYYTGSNYVIIAHSYYHEGKYRDAEIYFIKGINIIKKHKEKELTLVRVYIDMAFTYQKLKKKRLKLEYIKKAFNILKSHPSLNPKLMKELEAKIKRMTTPQKQSS